MDPAQYYTYSSLAQVYATMGRIDDALTAYMDYLNAPQMRANSYVDQHTANRIVAMYQATDRLEELQTKIAEDYSGRNGEQIGKFFEAVIAKRQGRLHEAEEILRGLYESAPQKSHLVEELMDIAQYGANTEGIIGFLDEQMAFANSSNPHRVAQMYLAAGSREQAYEAIERMVQRYGGSYGQQQGIEMFMEAGMWAEAEKFFRQHRTVIASDSYALREFATQAVSAHLLGMGFDGLIEGELGKPITDTTIGLLNYMIQFDPGNHEQHQGWLEPLLKREPDSSKVLFFAGNVARIAGDAMP
jgi:tetratricopeptide (TPR) repeat protein